MTRKTDRELETCHSDKEWYAIDKLGQLALFTTAGSAFVPDVYESGPAVYRKSIMHSEAISTKCGYTFVAKRKAGLCYTDWIEAAGRGCYAYDYDAKSRIGFILIALPEIPIVLKECDNKWISNLAEFEGAFGSEAMVIAGYDVLAWKLKGPKVSG